MANVQTGRFGRVSMLFVVAGLLTTCGGPTPGPSQVPGSGSPNLGSGPGVDNETASTVGGLVSETTSDGAHPVGGAMVELLWGDPNRHKEAVTNVAGRYLMSLPVPSSNTGAIDQPFELRVHKDGYRTVSRSFQFAYSVWDYGGVEVNVELIRD
jgi:hypothetical protein